MSAFTFFFKKMYIHICELISVSVGFYLKYEGEKSREERGNHWREWPWDSTNEVDGLYLHATPSLDSLDKALGLLGILELDDDERVRVVIRTKALDSEIVIAKALDDPSGLFLSDVFLVENNLNKIA